MNFWQKYNKDLHSLYHEIKNFNSHNKFNFIENNHYNHIRDLLALSIALDNNKNDKLKILDYGSNILTWVNLKNKIDTSLLSVKIFDPFSGNLEIEKYELDFDIDIINKISLASQIKFKMTIFGSCSQYIQDFYKDIENNNFIFSETVLFTHTPLSLVDDFIAKQNNSFNGTQYIRSFESLKKWMLSQGYHLLFKSTLPPQAAAVDKKYYKNIVYANLLFKKIN